LRWTCKSLRRLAEALQQQGHQVSRTLVGELLNAAGYSLQANRKTKEGNSHPDRDAQFAHINTQVAAAGGIGQYVNVKCESVRSSSSRCQSFVSSFQTASKQHGTGAPGISAM
jgi:hypothetical protein